MTRKRKLSLVGDGAERLCAINGPRGPLVSQADAAKKLDVSVETVKRAKVVQTKGVGRISHKGLIFYGIKFATQISAVFAEPTGRLNRP